MGRKLTDLKKWLIAVGTGLMAGMLSYLYYSEGIFDLYTNSGISDANLVVLLLGFSLNIAFFSAGTVFLYYFSTFIFQSKTGNKNNIGRILYLFILGMACVLSGIVFHIALDHNPQNEFYINPENLIFLMGSCFILIMIAPAVVWIVMKISKR